jgi:hypothetical protein
MALGVDGCADPSLCADCVGNHQILKKRYDGHVLLQGGEADPAAVALQPYGRQPVNIMCSTHATKKRLYLCEFEDCGNLQLCEECLPSHAGHRESVKTLKDVAAGLKKDIEATFFFPLPSPAAAVSTSAAPSPPAAASKDAAADARIPLVDAARNIALRVAAVYNSLVDAVPVASAAISSSQEALVRAVIERCAALRAQLDSARTILGSTETDDAVRRLDTMLKASLAALDSARIVTHPSHTAARM